MEGGLRMASKPGRIVVMWGHLLLLAVIAAVVIYYWMDTRAASMRTVNLLLVQPASIFALFLVLALVPQCFRRVGPDEEEGEKETFGDLARVFTLMAVFIAFALSMQYVGFDVATFSFMVVGLRLCGERNWFLNLGFSAAFTALLIWGYGAIIPFPFPLTVL